MNIKITLASVMMATFCSWLLMWLLYQTRKRKGFVKGNGIYSIVLLYMLCIARIFLPLDFPFTKGIPMKGMLSDFYRILWFDRYSVGRLELPILTFLCVVWFGVAFVLVVRFVRDYRSICRMVCLLGKREDEQCKRILQQVFVSTGAKRKVTVFYSKEITMPMSMGIRDWKVLLPDQEYSDQELYYILMHEYRHLLNGDLKVKMLTYIFCCIFWWNPVVYLLGKGLEQSLEMKCDLCVTEKLSLHEVANYLQTIVTAIKSCGKKRKSIMMNGAVSLGDCGQGEMKERFRFVIESRKGDRNRRWSMVLFTSMFLVVWLASYSILPQPSYDPPIDDIVTGPNVFELSPDNAYLFFEEGVYYLLIQLETGEKIINQVSENGRLLFESFGFEVRE